MNMLVNFAALMVGGMTGLFIWTAGATANKLASDAGISARNNRGSGNGTTTGGRKPRRP